MTVFFIALAFMGGFIVATETKPPKEEPTPIVLEQRVDEVVIKDLSAK